MVSKGGHWSVNGGVESEFRGAEAPIKAWCLTIIILTTCKGAISTRRIVKIMDFMQGIRLKTAPRTNSDKRGGGVVVVWLKDVILTRWR